MNRLRKALVVATIVGAVGVSYALFTLKGLPNSFDWEEDDNE